jgi:hypothetical protein
MVANYSKLTLVEVGTAFHDVLPHRSIEPMRPT